MITALYKEAYDDTRHLDTFTEERTHILNFPLPLEPEKKV